MFVHVGCLIFVASNVGRSGAARISETCAKRVHITWRLPAEQWTAAMTSMAHETDIAQLMSTVG